MSDHDLMLGMSRKTRLKAEVTYLMLKGAGYAAAFVVAIWFVIAVIGWFGRTVLPEDAQLAADPAPQAFVEFAAQARARDAAMMAPATEDAPADAAATEAAPAEGATEEAAPAGN